MIRGCLRFIRTYPNLAGFILGAGMVATSIVHAEAAARLRFTTARPGVWTEFITSQPWAAAHLSVFGIGGMVVMFVAIARAMRN